MDNLEKTIEVQGTEKEYTVEVKADKGKIKMRCNCEAGIHKRLCKHITYVATTDEDLKPFLVDANLYDAFSEIHHLKKEIERMQAENRRLRIKIEKAIF